MGFEDISFARGESVVRGEVLVAARFRTIFWVVEGFSLFC